MDLVTHPYLPTLTGVTPGVSNATSLHTKATLLGYPVRVASMVVGMIPRLGYDTYVTLEVTTPHTSVPRVTASAQRTVTKSAIVS